MFELRGLLICLSFFLTPPSSFAKILDSSDVPWFAKLKSAGVRSFNVCGSAEILLTRKSLSKHFEIGPHGFGYLLTEMLPMRRYFELLTDLKLEESKTALRGEFLKSRLWSYSKDEGFENLGPPSRIEFHHTASIRDCVEGARTTLGSDCSRSDGRGRVTCCREKFQGPVLYWGEDGGVRLMYSPDPSVRLKVPSEKKHRYCNIHDRVEIR